MGTTLYVPNLSPHFKHQIVGSTDPLQLRDRSLTKGATLLLAVAQYPAVHWFISLLTCQKKNENIAHFQTDPFFPKPSSPWRQTHSTSFWLRDSNRCVFASQVPRLPQAAGQSLYGDRWRSWGTNSYRMPNIFGGEQKEMGCFPWKKKKTNFPWLLRNVTASAEFLARFKSSITWFTTSMCSSWEELRLNVCRVSWDPPKGRSQQQ